MTKFDSKVTLHVFLFVTEFSKGSSGHLVHYLQLFLGGCVLNL